MVFWRWLENIPLADPIERKLAPILQLALIAIIVGAFINFSTEAAIGEGTTDVIGGAIFITLCLIPVMLIRAGYFKVATWMLMIVLLLGNNTRLMRAAIEDTDEALLTFFLPITIAGVLLGRRTMLGMFAISCLIIVSPDNAERLDTVTISVFILNAALVSFLVDLLGSTLRHELRLALIRNKDLEQAHQALETSSAELFKLNERLTITLKSIGDAVITTDANVRVTLLNGVAEQLTGWTQAEAEGQLLSTVFHIINEATREVVESPADKVMREGITVGLANHTVLIAKDGREVPIDDSGAPIIDNQGKIAGVVLVFRDITERRETEAREKELIAHSERQHLARELHDSVSQTLFATNVMAASLPNLFKVNPDRGLQQLTEIQGLTRGAMAEMRTLLLELRPENVIKMNLGDLLQQLGSVAQARQRIGISVVIQGDDSQLLPEEIHLALYRIAQESLNNVVSHAQAKQARVRLNRTPDKTELVIVDNGRGFDTSQPRAGFGLTSMQERAASIKAAFRIQSRDGLGTRITVVWEP